MSAYARCGVESLELVRCEGSRYSRAVVRCLDGVERTIGEPRPCEYRQGRPPRELAESFCQYRCDRPITDCSREPRLDSLIGAICRSVHACRSDISVEYCREHIEDISVSDELGLSEGSGETTFAVIRQALADGTIQWDRAVYCDCLLRLKKFPSCGGVPEFEPFGGPMLEEMIPEECGNDQYPGTLLPDNFNPVTGTFCTSDSNCPPGHSCCTGCGLSVCLDVGRGFCPDVNCPAP